MKIRFAGWRILLASVAIVAFVAGYFIVERRLPANVASAEHGLIMPEEPNIVYLAPTDTAQRMLDAEALVDIAASPVVSWRALRTLAQTEPLDALLIDAPLLNEMPDSDQEWLRAQLRDGVTLVGLGVNDDKFAQTLGISTFRAPGEGTWERGPQGYRLVQLFVLAHPDDWAKIDDVNWAERLVRGEDGGPFESITMEHPLLYSSRLGQGELTSDEEVEHLSVSLMDTIQYVYEKRAEFAEELNREIQ